MTFSRIGRILPRVSPDELPASTPRADSPASESPSEVQAPGKLYDLREFSVGEWVSIPLADAFGDYGSPDYRNVSGGMRVVSVTEDTITYEPIPADDEQDDFQGAPV